MNEVSYFDSMRKKHLSPQRQGEYIYISTEDMGEVEGVLHLRYSDFINGNYHPTRLHLDDKKRKIPRIDKWIGLFPHIEILALSRDLIPFQCTNLDNLRTFILSNFCDEKLLNRASDYSWAEYQIMPNVTFYLNAESQGIYDIGGITSNNLPNLEWLQCNLDNKGNTLEIIREFKKLTSLDVNFVKNQDIFGAFDNRLRVLAMGGFTKNSSLKEIRNQTNLEIICINGYKSEFDLEWLLDLNLKEIQLISCPNILNADCLLEMEYLESIYILDCKKSLSKNLKSRLRERTFVYLDIGHF